MVFYVFFYVFCVCELYYLLFFFFFQAEDGIRDLVRSRGLGDVYKRQVEGPVEVGMQLVAADVVQRLEAGPVRIHHPGEEAVSYTHLTLPTSDLV